MSNQAAWGQKIYKECNWLLSLRPLYFDHYKDDLQVVVRMWIVFFEQFMLAGSKF